MRVSHLLNYGAAIVFASAALLLRYALDPWLGDAQPLSLLFGAIALTVWRGGIGPAVFASAFGYTASDYLFIPPRGIFAVAGWEEAISLLIYLISCAIIIGFGSGMRSANRRAREYAHCLEEKQVQLELAERRKDEFLATLAHELRGPLAPISTAVSLLIPRDPELSTARAIISRQVQHMVRLIEDLLDLSRIRAGRIHLEKERVDLRAVLTHALETARPNVESAGHELRVSLPPQPVFLNADATRLAQVFTNLLHNAARYTPRGGHIDLQVLPERDTVVVSVRDDGIGIPAELLPRVFEMFLQADRSAERKGGGLGIGLSLVRQLAQLHGGHVEAASGGLGKGSEFRVRLPIAAGVTNAPAPPALPQTLESGTRDEAAVLIVEWGSETAESLAAALSAVGLVVHSTHSDADTVRVGARVQPRAVVVDLRTESTGRGELCRQIRRYPWGERAFLVGVTGPEEPGGADPQANVLDAQSSDPHTIVQLILQQVAAVAHE